VSTAALRHLFQVHFNRIKSITVLDSVITYLLLGHKVTMASLLLTSHRIAQNGRGWKGPLWVI